MTIWRKGMLVVCIKTGQNKQTTRGAVYRISAIEYNGVRSSFNGKINNFKDGINALTLEGLYYDPSYPVFDCSSRFRPAVNDDKSADEQFKTELDDIINGRVPAEMSL